MRNHLATCILLGAAMLGCKKDQAPIVDGDVGVRECDEYLARAEKCLGTADAQGAAETSVGLKSQRSAWKTLATQSATKVKLAEQCSLASEVLKKQCP